MTLATKGRLLQNSQHSEEDNSLVHSVRSHPASRAECDTASQAASEQSNDVPSPRSSAIEGDVSTIDEDTSQSETEKADDSTEGKGRAGSDASTRPGSSGDGNALTIESAQKQLEMMSQAVMSAWSTLRTIESEFGSHDTLQSQPTIKASFTDPSTGSLCRETIGEAIIETEQDDSRYKQHDIPLATLLSAEATVPPTKGPWARPAKDSKAEARSQVLGSTPGSMGHAKTVLASAKRVLDSTPGVSSTEIVLWTAGTIATLFITLLPNAEQSLRLNAAAIAKAALLEAAACSEMTYVLGYEAVPFLDLSSANGFAATLAIAPHSWKFSACWDTFKLGRCPRGSKCKWRHPRRQEIQPIQVIFR